MLSLPSICASCALFVPGIGEEPAHCEAFPKGIPVEILFGGFDHRKPFNGDNGVTWRLAEDDPEAEQWLAAYEKNRARALEES